MRLGWISRGVLAVFSAPTRGDAEQLASRGGLRKRRRRVRTCRCMSLVCAGSGVTRRPLSEATLARMPLENWPVARGQFGVEECAAGGAACGRCCEREADRPCVTCRRARAVGVRPRGRRIACNRQTTLLARSPYGGRRLVRPVARRVRRDRILCRRRFLTVSRRTVSAVALLGEEGRRTRAVFPVLGALFRVAIPVLEATIASGASRRAVALYRLHAGGRWFSSSITVIGRTGFV